jgi:hypothetical protein
MEAAVLVADHGNGAAVDVLATQTLIDEPLIDESVRVSEQYGDELVALHPELCLAVDLSTSASRAARWRHLHLEQALSHNKEGEKRRQKREEEDVSGDLRKRRREQVQRCRERQRKLLRPGERLTSRSWDACRRDYWRDRQEAERRDIRIQVSYYFSEARMTAKRERCEERSSARALTVAKEEESLLRVQQREKAQQAAKEKAQWALQVLGL